MATLVKLDECRLETLNGLKVTTIVKLLPGCTQLKQGDKFRLVIWVQNTLKAGGAGGHAHFKNIKIRVRGTEHADLLESQNGPPVAGNTKSYMLRLGPDNTLEEEERRKHVAWFEAKHACPDVERIAHVIVRAYFDIERYLRGKWSRTVQFDIVPD